VTGVTAAARTNAAAHIRRMGFYEVKPTGEFQRHSISYAEELRPLAAGSVG
jgi:hypothetical protein